MPVSTYRIWSAYLRARYTGSRARRLYGELKGYLLAEKSLQTYRIAAAYELYVNGDRMAALLWDAVRAIRTAATTVRLPGQSLAPAAAGTIGPAEVERIAEKVYRQIEERLRSEKMRRGM